MIVWLMSIDLDEYVRCIRGCGATYTRRQLEKMFRNKPDAPTVYVGYEVTPDQYHNGQFELLRHFQLHRRDHFFGGVGLQPGQWWSDPYVIPAEGIRVRDIFNPPTKGGK